MEDNINVFGELEALPKDMKFIVMTNLDAQSLGRLMQTNKSFNKLPNETGIWKYKCLTTWKLSPESKIHKIFSHNSDCINFLITHQITIPASPDDIIVII